MLLSKRLLLIASRRTAATKRACTPPAQLLTAETATAMATTPQIAAVIGRSMTATGLLSRGKQTATGITATEAETAAEEAAEIAAGTAVETETAPGVSHAIAATGMAQVPLK